MLHLFLRLCSGLERTRNYHANRAIAPSCLTVLKTSVGPCFDLCLDRAFPKVLRGPVKMAVDLVRDWPYFFFTVTTRGNPGWLSVLVTLLGAQSLGKSLSIARAK